MDGAAKLKQNILESMFNDVTYLLNICRTVRRNVDNFTFSSLNEIHKYISSSTNSVHTVSTAYEAYESK